MIESLLEWVRENRSDLMIHKIDDEVDLERRNFENLVWFYRDELKDIIRGKNVLNKNCSMKLSKRGILNVVTIKDVHSRKEFIGRYGIMNYPSINRIYVVSKRAREILSKFSNEKQKNYI